jgi:hypothetical protein
VAVAAAKRRTANTMRIIEVIVSVISVSGVVGTGLMRVDFVLQEK